MAGDIHLYNSQDCGLQRNSHFSLKNDFSFKRGKNEP